MNGFEYPPEATPLDPDELDGLRLRHITTRSELDRWEQENIAEAMRWLERRHNRTYVLNEKFIQTLHGKMFGNVWKWVGQFRRTNKNIGVDWPRIPTDLRTLLNDVQFWMEKNTYPVDEIAARLHHRLVYIHLFPNGNGRHARLVADTLLTDVLTQNPFTWGNDDLGNAGDARDRYITALKAADDYDYNPLLNFVRS